MHLLGPIFFGIIAIFWIAYGSRTALGALTLPWLKDFAPAEDNDCPRVTLLFAARDEEEKLAQALETLRQIDYPALEIVAANDRSSDGTAEILSDAARRDPRLRVINIAELPAGPLGKPHPLQGAFEAAGGAWVFFSHADVRVFLY